MSKLLPSFEPFVFAVLLIGIMSGLISVTAAYASTGSTAGLATAWLKAWLSSWLVALPTVLVVPPLVDRLAALLVRAPGPTGEGG